MTNKSIALDLKVARRKTGLRQVDLAHLLAIDKQRVCRLERGETLPTVGEVAALSFVYGKPMEALLSSLVDATIGNLAARLRTLPDAANGGEEPGFNRAPSCGPSSKRRSKFTIGRGERT